MHLVQLIHPQIGRRIALVQGKDLILINQYSTIYHLAKDALAQGGKITDLINKFLSREFLDYDPIYEGTATWKLMPAFDHPLNPNNCLITGTGLTHKASADNRQKMNEAEGAGTLTDSMKMYLLGVEGGRPSKGSIGVQPEWFYKGNGSMLCGHNDPLDIPNYGDDGGEEPEAAGIYLNDDQGTPWRIGFAIGNEFSDHVMEKKNYLYLAPSKIRTCSIGPELVITETIGDIQGHVRIHRDEKILWEKAVKTGDINMAHSLANLENHHFKYQNHRLPDQVHIHFFGADAFSFGDQIKLQSGDIAEIEWSGLGRPLRNVIRAQQTEEKLIEPKVMI